MDLTIIVPTFNEGPNVAELVRRLADALEGRDAEVLFVDDSTDDTPEIIEGLVRESHFPVRMIHREVASGGLGGAVVEGALATDAELCIVMDGDLQHPPEVVPELLARLERGDADVVVASRYIGGGSAKGLSDASRVAVSKVSTAVTKAMFPIRLRGCSDPMTGFFAFRRQAIDFDGLKPRGFKILLEILARQQLRIAEIPFNFADRFAGASKATLRQGFSFIAQLTLLRFGRMSLFALIGALGALANIGIMAALTALGMNYIWAAIIGAEVTIIGNFFLIEAFVFRDMRAEASGFWARFIKSFTFNNAEALIRIPILAILVENLHIHSVIALALTLVVAFLVRFVFHALVVYAPKRKVESRTPDILQQIDAEVVRPGEL